MGKTMDEEVEAALMAAGHKMQQMQEEIERLRERVSVLNLALMALLPVARTGGDVMSQEHASVVAMAEGALKD